MKKCILLLLGAVLYTIVSYAQTSLSSHFSTNTTLTVANSPYLVTTSLNVNSGVTLTVENGVVIKFASGTYLQVFGTLNAKGVTFTANSSTPQKDSGMAFMFHMNGAEKQAMLHLIVVLSNMR